MLGCMHVLEQASKLLFVSFCWVHEALAELIHSKACIWSQVAGPEKLLNSLFVKH